MNAPWEGGAANSARVSARLITAPVPLMRLKPQCEQEAHCANRQRNKADNDDPRNDFHVANAAKGAGWFV